MVMALNEPEILMLDSIRTVKCVQSVLGGVGTADQSSHHPARLELLRRMAGGVGCPTD